MNTSADELAVHEQDLLCKLRDTPEDGDSLLRLGWVRLQRGDSLGAREALLKAHVLQPRSAIVRIYAARALAECSDYRAPQLIRDWRDWLPLPDQQQVDLADAMQRTDWTGEAVGVLEDLLHRSPQHRNARLLLAALCERVNQLDRARELVDSMLAEDLGDRPDAYVELMHQRARLLARAGDPAAARRALEDTGPRFDGDADHYFALAGFADRLDEAEAAMDNLATAHALQLRALERSAPQRLRPGAPLLPNAVVSLDAASVAAWPALTAPDASQSPVFVVGFPRSGTTLVEQMLDAHPGLQAMDERPHFEILADQLADYGVSVPLELGKLTQADCDELRKGYLVMACSRIERRWGTRLVDKNPLNMLRLPMIHRLFPDARWILMLRDPRDVVLSNYQQNYRSAVLMAASRDLSHLARAYVEAFEHWFHHVSILAPSVLTVRYEELAADPEREAGRMAGFLGIDDASPMLDAARHARGKGFIGTPSYAQVVEPVNQRAIGRWKRYRRWFEGVQDTLAPVMQKLGYPATGDA